MRRLTTAVMDCRTRQARLAGHRPEVDTFCSAR